MVQWTIPTLSEILARAQPAAIADSNTKAERSWCGAIAAVNLLLDRTPDNPGLILASSPILTYSHLPIATWLFSSAPSSHPTQFQLPPATASSKLGSPCNATPTPGRILLLPNDPLKTEQFALILTPNFSLLLVLETLVTGNLGFRFSFDPDVVTLAWDALRSRVMLTGTASDLQHLACLHGELPIVAPPYQTVSDFSQLMVQYLPEPWVSPCETRAAKPAPVTPYAADLELLQAIAHEVKTPLSTIRTYTRLLLKRDRLPSKVLERLQAIDRECTEQIDRFDLIFRAVELETTSDKLTATHLTATSLIEVLQESIPRWQKQANRRNITLEAVLPQQMPMVVSDPTLLERVLANAIDNFTSSLPTGSRVQVKLTPAGDRLKLQLVCHDGQCQHSSHLSPFKALGQLLMFQPETGNLSLNFSVTKNLFEAIGGKLLLRQHPQQGTTMTMFLPMGLGDYCHHFQR
ncbi:sensor histidine kinase [Roseofilum casamattae]|uniref:histidine kinase n=1 Tax=Roseofilum casamattae BLCC-M143 TaxID=3022442 RepID=A0ABT7BSU2_9CYAN|nr:HAMP domain-containing sensor histidine kinase [Roseofilum casamattae]MDJ1182259.1 HAMP domain-containing sensor histidine kinase [Roseofilum casamattae BLCC-M143]